MHAAYRSDRDAVEERIAELEARIAEVDAKLAAVDVLQRERNALGQELAERRARWNASTEDRGAMSLLQNVRVARPCKASWDAMVGDDKVRHCQSCDRDVFNLSAMRAVEAEELLRQANGKVCTRFFQRPDGTVMTSDCPVGQKQAMRRRVAMAAAGGAMLATVSFPVAATTVTMGELEMPVHPVSPADDANAMVGQLQAPADVVDDANELAEVEPQTERSPGAEDRAPETLRSPTEEERLSRR